MAEHTLGHAFGEHADVELRLPATNAYASVVRTTAATLAARLDFTIDDIDDLRIAIGEAIALVLPEADPDTDLLCRFHIGTGSVTVTLRVDAVDEPRVDTDSFAWQVLDAMADDVTAESQAGRMDVRFTMRSQVSAQMTGADS